MVGSDQCHLVTSNVDTWLDVRLKSSTPPVAYAILAPVPMSTPMLLCSPTQHMLTHSRSHSSMCLPPRQSDSPSVHTEPNIPIPSISTLISSPWFKTTLGFLIAPIPGGVPVIIKEPRSKVVPWDRKAIVSDTPKIISLVVESWTTVPLWMALMRRLCGSETCSCATSTGPMGAEESKPGAPVSKPWAENIRRRSWSWAIDLNLWRRTTACSKTAGSAR